MKSLNLGSIAADAFKDVWKVHKWAIKLFFKPLKAQNNKSNQSNVNKQKVDSIRDSLKKNTNGKKSNANRTQISSGLSSKINNR